MASATPLIARGVRKRFGGLDALAGVDLEIGPSTIHGLLGPNGAGKSTLVRILATLIPADAGTVSIAGSDVAHRASDVRRRIGLVGQQAALDEVLSGRQNLVMFARLSGLGSLDARERADELLDRFRLAGAADRSVSTYSGGMRRRLDIAAALILDPAVLFLDEPTTGLDPRARSEVWDAVRGIADAGTSVLLTTQYLDEADQLAARISVLNAGSIVAEDTPERLKRRLGGDRVVVIAGDRTPADAVASAVQGLGRPVAVDVATGEVAVDAPAGAADLVAVVHALDAAGIRPDDLVLRRPTLDEVFLALTRPAADQEVSR